MIRIPCPQCACVVEAAEGRRTAQCRFCLAKIPQPDSVKLGGSVDAAGRYAELMDDIRNNYYVALKNNWEIAKPSRIEDDSQVPEPLDEDDPARAYVEAEEDIHVQAGEPAAVADIYEFIKRDSRLLSSGIRERAASLGEEGIIDALFMWMMLEADALIESGFYIEQRLRASVFRMIGGTASRIIRLFEKEKLFNEMLLRQRDSREADTPFLDIVDARSIPAVVRYQARWAEKKAELDEMVQLAESDRGRYPARGFCYITTAALEATRQDDGGEVLTAFRDFRDGYLAQIPGGTNQIARYYRTAPVIVENISALREPEAVYGKIWGSYLKPCYESLLKGDQQACHERYVQMVFELEELYGKL